MGVHKQKPGQRDSEAQFRALFEQAAVGVAQVDTNTGRFVRANQRYCNIVGYTVAEMMDLTQQAISHPDDLPAHLRELESLKAGAIREFSLEERYLRKDGHVVWVELSASAMWVPGGQPDFHIAVVVDITGRKSVEEELRKFSRAVEQSVSSVMITDTNSRIEFVNPAFTRLSGYSAAELIGEKPNISKSGLTPSEHYEQLWQVISAGGEWQGEFLNRKKNGDLYWVSASISPIRNADGVITHYLSIQEDITERKRIEDALAQQNVYLSALHDISVGVLSRLDLEDLLQPLIDRVGQLLHTKHGFIALVDRERDQLVFMFGSGAFTSLIGLRLQPGEGLAGKVWQTGRPLVVDDYRAWDGQSPQVRSDVVKTLVGLPLTSHSQVIGVIGVGRDDTSDKRFADEEIEVLNRLAHLASISIENARLFDETQRLFRIEQQRSAELATIVSVSEALANNVDVKALSQIVGDKIVEVFNADAAAILLLDAQTNTIHPLYEFDEGRYVENVQPFPLGQGLTSEIIASRQPLLLGSADEAAQHGVYYPPEAQAINPHVTQSYLGVPILAGERVLGVLAVHSYSQHAFDYSNARLLSTLSTDIGAALENARLFAEAQKAREEAEAANASKSAFLANISHELRTPLNAILGFADLLRRDRSLTADQREYLEIINSSGTNLLSLINEVLEISKIESGRATLREDNFDLYRMLDSIGEMFSLRASEKGLVLTCNRQGAIPRYVRTDEIKLRHALNNLMGNAIKFTQHGSVTVRVRVLERSGDQVTLQFDVEDTGPGIAQEEMASIFEPFVQASGGQRAQEGTGLGLAITRQYVRLMGGDVRASTMPDGGSLFQFEVRVQTTDQEQVQTTLPARRVLGTEPEQVAAHGGAYRLLIAEDDEPSRRLLVRLLEPLGFSLREAVDGREAIDIWQDWKPDLIWMDMQMPLINGHEATRRIRAAGGKQTVIVALTAASFEEDREKVLAEGCDDFVRKPFQAEELLGMLSKHLGVRFLYEEEVPAPMSGDSQDGASAEVSPSLPDLSGLSPDLLAELHRATVLADTQQMLSVIAEVHMVDPLLADDLAKRVRDFDYRSILLAIAGAGVE